MILFQVKDRETAKIINNLKNKFSSSDNDIRTVLVKNSAPVTVSYLTFLVNLSMNKGEFLKELKKEKLYRCIKLGLILTKITTDQYDY